MAPERIEFHLNAISNMFLGGQKDLIRAALVAVANEQAHLTRMSVTAARCSCELCAHSRALIEQRGLA